MLDQVAPRHPGRPVGAGQESRSSVDDHRRQGYDSTNPRWFLRAHDVEPVIKHRDFMALHLMHNSLHDEAEYNR